MLAISIFSFSHNVFKRLLFQCRQKSGLCGKYLIYYHKMPHFDTQKIYSCGITLWEKEKWLVSSNFFFSHNVFCPYIAHIFHFKSTLKCWLQFVSISDQSKILLSGNELKTLPVIFSLSMICLHPRWLKQNSSCSKTKRAEKETHKIHKMEQALKIWYVDDDLVFIALTHYQTTKF